MNQNYDDLHFMFLKPLSKVMNNKNLFQLQKLMSLLSPYHNLLIINTKWVTTNLKIDVT